MERIVIAVRDIHGCIEEFDELLKTLSYNPKHHRMVLLGDLMDRGPDPVGCVRRAQELNLECIMGNHEEKHLRWLKHEAKKRITGKPNPMKPLSREALRENQALSERDIRWMQGLPLKLDLGNNWWAVHAGCEPCYTLSKQSPDQIMRVRYVNHKGRAVALNPDKSQPKDTVYWTEMWQGPESIVFGHNAQKEVRLSLKENGVTCLGIDTGCCFGGNLTAAFITSPLNVSWVQVKAKKKYFDSDKLDEKE